MFICKYFVFFIIYSFIGWIYETIYCTINEKSWQNRGFLYGPCIPLYGVGATLAQIIFIDLPFDVVHNASYVGIFFGCAIGSFFLEYGTSYILEKKFHARWWDYSNMPLNINGRVCLPFTCCFGIAGIIVTQIIIPPIMSSISYIPAVVIELFALIFMFMFGMDMALTISALTTFAKDFERINEQVNTQMAEYVENIQTSLEDAKLARIEKSNERKEAAFVKRELTAEKIATPIEKFEAQNNVLPSSAQAWRTSSPCSFIHPVEPLTTFTPLAQAFR